MSIDSDALVYKTRFSYTLRLKKGTPTLSTVTLERINGF